jgi:hypothetical protein
MGVIRKPEVGKHYILGSSIILVTHVDKKTYTYSYVNHYLFTSKDSFTWNIKTFNETEITELLGALL